MKESCELDEGQNTSAVLLGHATGMKNCWQGEGTLQVNQGPYAKELDQEEV